MEQPTPTDRELEILKILWRKREAAVRDVYEAMRDQAPIVQNTVQAFLRVMEQKGLVEHRVQGRAFIYRPRGGRDLTIRRMAGQLLDVVFDGAIDQLVDSLFDHRAPSQNELARLEELIAEARRAEQDAAAAGTRNPKRGSPP